MCCWSGNGVGSAGGGAGCGGNASSSSSSSGGITLVVELVHDEKQADKMRSDVDGRRHKGRGTNGTSKIEPKRKGR